MNSYSYEYGGNLYLNITNRCMMACPYCIKNKWAGKFRGNTLKLDKEPTVQEVPTMRKWRWWHVRTTPPRPLA